MKKKTLLLTLGLSIIATGCANIHEYINSDFANAFLPNATSAVKTVFYSDRYQYNIPPDRQVPKAFANSAPDYIGEYKFAGFTRDTDNKSRNFANYYIPVKSNGNDTVLVSTGVFANESNVTKTGIPYRGMTALVEYNCKKSTFTYLSGESHTDKDFYGKPITKKVVPKKDQVSAPITPNSLESFVKSKVCD